MHIKVKLYKKTLKTVRIFVSSIFRNMHAERDHLMKVVFPELWERCAKCKLHLIDVDLRWDGLPLLIAEGKYRNRRLS